MLRKIVKNFDGYNGKEQIMAARFLASFTISRERMEQDLGITVVERSRASTPLITIVADTVDVTQLKRMSPAEQDHLFLTALKGDRKAVEAITLPSVPSGTPEPGNGV